MAIQKKGSSLDIQTELVKRRFEIEEIVKRVQDDSRKEEDDAAKNKDFEETLYKKYLKNNTGKKYITLEDIDSLGVDYHVLFIVSVKNVGKTTNIIYNRFNYYKNLNKKVVFGRCTLSEIEKSKGEYNNDALEGEKDPNLSGNQINPFIIKQTKGSYLLYDKNDPKKECGKVVDFRNCNVSSGGSHFNYGAIIFDEILSWDTKKLMKLENVEAFDAFVSSVVRNKVDFKIYLMGNIRKDNNIILSAYGIHSDDNLRYINRGTPENPCKILYINVNNIYTGGIQNQIGAVQQASAASKVQLYSNKILTFSSNIITPKIYNGLKFYRSFILKIKNVFELYECRKVKVSENIYLCVRCREYLPYLNVLGPVYTNSKCLANTYPNLTHTPTVTDLHNEIFSYVNANKILYYDDVTRELCAYLYEEIEKNIELVY